MISSPGRSALFNLLNFPSCSILSYTERIVCTLEHRFGFIHIAFR